LVINNKLLSIRFLSLKLIKAYSQLISIKIMQAGHRQNCVMNKNVEWAKM